MQYLCNKFCWRTIQFSSGDITLGGLKLHRHFRCLRWTVSPTGVSFSPVTSTRVLRYLRKQKQKTTNKPTGRSLVSGWGVTQFRQRLATFHWRRKEKFESMSLCQKKDYLWKIEAKDPHVQPWPLVTHDSILTRIISCKESCSRKRMDVCKCFVNKYYLIYWTVRLKTHWVETRGVYNSDFPFEGKHLLLLYLVLWVHSHYMPFTPQPWKAQLTPSVFPSVCLMWFQCVLNVNRSWILLKGCGFLHSDN